MRCNFLGIKIIVDVYPTLADLPYSFILLICCLKSAKRKHWLVAVKFSWHHQCYQRNCGHCKDESRKQKNIDQKHMWNLIMVVGNISSRSKIVFYTFHTSKAPEKLSVHTFKRHESDEQIRVNLVLF